MRYALSAEKIVMLAVAGLGGYAVYRMTRASASVPAEENTMPMPILGANAPPLPAGVVVPAVASLDGPTLHLDANRYYRGRFESAEDPSALAARMGAIGFAAQVVTTAGAARAAGFPEWSLASPTTGTRWFFGTSSSTSAQPRPPGLALLWIANPP